MYVGQKGEGGAGGVYEKPALGVSVTNARTVALI